MCSDGTCFYKLNEGVAACYRIFVAEVGDERLTEALHVNDIVAKLFDEALDSTLRGNSRNVAPIEIKDELLAILFVMLLVRFFGHEARIRGGFCLCQDLFF